MSDFKKTAYGAQAPKNDINDDIDAMIDNADRLIESVYRSISSPTPRHNALITSGRSSGSTLSPKTPSPRTPSPKVNMAANRRTLISPSSHQIELEIERINRFCDTVDQNLRIITQHQQPTSPPQQLRRRSVPRACRSLSNARSNTSTRPLLNQAIRENGLTPVREQQPSSNRRRHRALTPEPIIDLSDLHTPRSDLLSFAFNEDEDDVILVSSDLADVVDLCTPIRDVATSNPNYSATTNELRRRINNSRNNYSSRSRSPIRVNSTTSTNSRRSVQTSTTNILEENEEMPTHVLVQDESPAKRVQCGDCIKSKTNNDASTTSERAPFMCPVCMDSALNNKPTSTKCGHVFCEPCIRQAMRLTKKCPMCNSKLNANCLFRIYL